MIFVFVCVSVIGPMANSPHSGIANAVNSPSPAMTASTCSNASSQLWKTRLTNIKNSFLGSPRFHRRKLQGKFNSFLILSMN